MRFVRDNNIIFLRLDKGEEINKSIIYVAKEENINCCWVNGIGAIEDVEMGFYNIREKKYDKKIFKGDYELTSFMGNIAIKGEQQFLHSHVTISDESYKSIGGHLFEAKIKVAGEFFMYIGKKKIVRKMDPSIGLPLWEF